MKLLGLFFILISLSLAQGDLITEEEKDREQIDALKKEKNEIDRDKNVIWNWINFWKKPVSIEEAENIKSNGIEVGVNGLPGFKVTALPNSNGELIDDNYKFPNSNEACDTINDKLGIINSLQEYYYSYNDENGNQKAEKYPFNYVRTLNHKIYGSLMSL